MFSFRIRCVLELVMIALVWFCDNAAQANTIETSRQLRDAQVTVEFSLLRQRNSNGGAQKWGRHVARIGIALNLLYDEYFTRTTDSNTRDSREIAYEISIQVLADLLRDKKKELTASELATYVNGVFISCNDPRNFHGIDIVSMLRQRYNKMPNFSSPMVPLTLCIVKDKMTQADVDSLIEMPDDPHRSSSAGTKALKLMALTCINNLKQPDIKVDPTILKKLADDLKEIRYNSTKYLPTAALIMQALIASESEEDGLWNVNDAVNYVMNLQSSDGSFGNVINTYYMLPILWQRSLLNLTAAKCNFTTGNNEVTVTKDLHDKFGSKIYVKYTLWIGDDIDVTRTVQLRVVANNNTLFDIMNSVVKTDPTYRFEYEMLNGKPYIYEVSNIQDDPESNKFWFLYKTDKSRTKLMTLTSSPVDIIPKDKEEFILWYRSKGLEKIPPFVFNSVKFPQIKNLF